MVSTTPSTPTSGDTTTTGRFGPPFDDCDADIILQSSDNVHFLVHRVILSKASPIFRTMFASLAPPPRNILLWDECPTFQLTEDSRVLAALLSAIYPHSPATADSESHSLNDLIAPLVMARKYEMATASCRLFREFLDAKALQDNPIGVFCVAYANKMGNEARLAARALLKHRLTLDDIGDKLQYTNGPALHALWKFHRACSVVAIAVISDRDYSWIAYRLPDASTWFGESCSCTRFSIKVGESHYSVHKSWIGYIERACDALRDRPCSGAITHYGILGPSFEDETMCDFCRRFIHRLVALSHHLGEEVDRRVEEVSGALICIPEPLLI